MNEEKKGKANGKIPEKTNDMEEENKKEAKL